MAATTYAKYLRLGELLSLQSPLSEGPEHDETLFIVIHQVYELWFKELLHEIDYLVTVLDRGEVARALHTLKRVLTILKVVVAQVDVLETMTPLEFLSFRHRLDTASGLQSYQFRELEFVIGAKNPKVLERYVAGSPEREKLDARFKAPTLWDAFLRYLQREGHAVPESQLARDPTELVTPNAEIQAILVEAYRAKAVTGELCERLVDLDEGLQEWRYRHVKMVERTIGSQMGTGGSSGAGYLLATLNRPVFPDLWAIRSKL
ncbi:MAG TPA: tryptophan 2,3-dioxygenase family protein [Polyangiaceae bacterium]|jgi:tryptophan 2,3-dioxygenase|nr:tryptophan 2,3-dioxygenase family protein [Polyangiaceae bacterium]